MNITFLGATETVTGSQFLIETKKGYRLLVDCGMFQGIKSLREKNWRQLPYPPSSIEGVFLTHAHIDHSGYLPVLVREGFQGPIFTTEPTKELCSILLPDAGHLAEEDAHYANKKGFSKHHPALPLYTAKDGQKALDQFETKSWNVPFLWNGLSITFERAGHILGASHIRIEEDGQAILFSGDIGRYEDWVELPPQDSKGAHWIVMESTYGDRVHPVVDPMVMMGQLIRTILEKKSVLLIPSFAVGRVQSLLYLLYQTKKAGLAPEDLPIYVNSPMATQVSDLYNRYVGWHNLSTQVVKDMFGQATFVKTMEESKELNNRKGPMVIISASGMMTGGRVLHHLREFGPNPKNMILLPGFQTEGTRGASLKGGASHVKIHGQQIPINATCIHWDHLSAHGDQPSLLKWLNHCEQKPSKVFVVHGEPQSAKAFAKKIQEQFAVETVIPKEGSSFTLSS